ncbi:hypothetical protein QQF64_025155 [Cirrhinus molitorella]|uniref:Uncharacterized protein n=1 Tax=Cirrhinus molitorella TaxID=172907 RepID=A0ABR3NNK4_9TELE
MVFVSDARFPVDRDTPEEPSPQSAPRSPMAYALQWPTPAEGWRSHPRGAATWTLRRETSARGPLLFDGWTRTLEFASLRIGRSPRRPQLKRRRTLQLSAVGHVQLESVEVTTQKVAIRPRSPEPEPIRQSMKPQARECDLALCHRLSRAVSSSRRTPHSKPSPSRQILAVFGPRGPLEI